MADDKDVKEKWYYHLWEFFIHVLTITILFILIALAAIGLDYVMKGMKVLGIDGLMYDSFYYIKYLILIGDIFLFVVHFIVKLFEALDKICGNHIRKLIEVIKKLCGL